ncbi:hypothetical protein [Kitasatospora kifunensis]|uniref:Uncharacterized protein n=1 Tax=Kitasatospora kifunensis TaxID=58351 RepID=A0A7W7QXT0_KITKI|nr:hypothetical protein [Kitasatospora kifunensis]MBB4921499.1 hypothetical protein [Kitasatospora kifunensis]
MRFRQTAAAALGALVLLIAVPNSAYAATGEFEYKFGRGIPAALHDPEGGKCINLFGATEDDPAFAPKNFTDVTATVFLESGCGGDTYRVMPPGTKLGDRLKLRSVVFS